MTSRRLKGIINLCHILKKFDLIDGVNNSRIIIKTVNKTGKTILYIPEELLIVLIQKKTRSLINLIASL